MKFSELPLGIRLGLSIFRIALFAICLVIALFLEFAGEENRARKLLEWAQM